MIYEEETLTAIARLWLCEKRANKKDVLRTLAENEDMKLAKDCSETWFRGNIDERGLMDSFTIIRENPELYFKWDE